MKILSNEDIREVERQTLVAQGIDVITLIERVAVELSKEIKRHCRPDQPLIVLAGWGNNGADALETSRLLACDGYSPEIFLFNIGGDKLNPQCAEMKERVAATPNVVLHEINGKDPFRWPEPPATAVIIDGLFGSGLNKPLPRTFQMLARNINESGAKVISIDIPSGLFADWNGSLSRQDIFHAHLTLAVEFPRLSFMLADNAEAVGKWKTIHIGYDREAIRNAPYTYVLTDRPLVARYLERRKPFTSKADYGHAIIYCGSRGMMGAAVLAARGALRTGAGKVTVYGPSDGNCIVQTAVPEAMYMSDANPSLITEMPYESRFTAFGVGCGIGTDELTAQAFEKFVRSVAAAGKRMVIDADALNIIAKKPNILNYLPPLSVITPHAGEFDRIFGKSNSDEERLKNAIKCAEDYSLIIVLKGHRTAVIRPDGKIMFNSSGTPAMATGGSGDVLTGVITGLMAIGLDSEIAAFVGPYIHGVAGELAEKKHGEYGVTATDIAQCVGQAINLIMTRKE